MNKGSLLEVSKPFEAFKAKAEQYLYSQFPQMIDSGNFQTIHIGRNRDGGVGDRGGYRVQGTHGLMSSALLLEVPSRMMGEKLLEKDFNASKKTVISRASDAVKAYAVEQVGELMAKGATKAEAQARVTDSIAKFGFFDKKLGQFVVERTSGRVKDSVLAGLQTPYWDIAKIQKIFKQPFIRGYSEGLVNKVGIPNIWADLVQVWTETFEGKARLQNVARGDGAFNTSIGAKNRTSTIISEMVNLVIDYEGPTPNEQRVGAQEGNWLTNAVIGDRDVYANLMLEQLLCQLYYFGDAATGFDGLQQIANRDGTYEYFASNLAPAEYMWQHDGAGTGGTANPNLLVGAQLLLQLNHMIGEKLEALYFLPVNIKVTCSPILYKALKFSMLSQTYNQNNPLSIINKAFDAGNKIVGTLATRSLDGVFQSFELVPDPMLMPNTPFNATAEDLMFITFPSLQSELDEGGLEDIVMAPVAIDKMILPSAPGFRDGTVRTSLKRIGSIIAPVAGTVHVISGMGTNSRYTPA